MSSLSSHRPESSHRPDYSGYGSDSSQIKSQERIRVGTKGTEPNVKSQNGRFSWLRAGLSDIATRVSDAFTSSNTESRSNNGTVDKYVEDMKQIKEANVANLRRQTEIESELKNIHNILQQKREFINSEGGQIADDRIISSYITVYKDLISLRDEYNKLASSYQHLDKNSDGYVNKGIGEMIRKEIETHLDFIFSLPKEVQEKYLELIKA